MAHDSHAGGLARAPASTLSRLATVLEKASFPMWIEVIADDQTNKFATLMADLRQRYSETGDGKRIPSGSAYMGLEPALAWTNACRDRLYPVMKQSIESFERRWSLIRPHLDHSYHYVSLGPGDGQKDAVVMPDLHELNPDLCYVAMDASTELLRLAVRDLTIRLKYPPLQILPLPWDFSAPENLAKLRWLLTEMFGGAPVLFSLLGNTLANFDDDTDLLRSLVQQLLRPQDRILLEVTTTPCLNEDVAKEAAMEYELSPSFGEFVTSALRRYTDLHVEKESVEYEGMVEGDRAALIKMIYRNQTDNDISIKLPDSGDSVRFRRNDTIRLNLTRKYTQEGVKTLLTESGLSPVHEVHEDFAAMHNGTRFGMDLILAGAVPEDPAPPTRLADYIWAGEQQ